MKKQKFEARAMKYFAENIILKENWRTAKECVKEIRDMKFNEIITGEIELEIDTDVKGKIAQRIPCVFDSSDFPG